MKAKLIIVLLVISSSFSYAQLIKSIGIKSGITFSKQYWEELHFSPAFNFETSPGLYEAITLDFIDNTYWQISADLGIYQSYSKAVVNPFTFMYWLESVPEDLNFKFGFMTISPVVKFKIPVKSFTPYILIAPRLDYYYSDISSDRVNYYKSEIIKPVWGLTFGEGLAYRWKNVSLFAEYQFFYSFNDILTFDRIDAMDDSKDRVKANTHVISLGIKYHFIKKLNSTSDENKINHSTDTVK